MSAPNVVPSSPDSTVSTITSSSTPTPLGSLATTVAGSSGIRVTSKNTVGVTPVNHRFPVTNVTKSTRLEIRTSVT